MSLIKIQRILFKASLIAARNRYLFLFMAALWNHPSSPPQYHAQETCESRESARFLDLGLLDLVHKKAIFTLPCTTEMAL